MYSIIETFPHMQRRTSLHSQSSAFVATSDCELCLLFCIADQTRAQTNKPMLEANGHKSVESLRLLGIQVVPRADSVARISNPNRQLGP